MSACRQSRVFLAALALWAWSGVCVADDAPQLPCAAAPVPDYPAPGAPPRFGLWKSGNLNGEWQPPLCTGWSGSKFALLVALAGRFEEPGGAAAILARIGAVSTLKTVRYWSISDQSWEPLYDRAFAVAGKDGARRRGDFSAAELQSGRDFYFDQADNRTGDDVVYRLRVERADPAHLVVTLENVTAARFLFVPVADPGDLQSIFFLDRAAGGAWTFYSLLRVKDAPPLFTLFVRDGSYVNRAVALFRHIAGEPTDGAPPSVR